MAQKIYKSNIQKVVHSHFKPHLFFYFIASTLSDLLIELADAYSSFDSNAGEYTCTTTSGPAPSDPYLINCDNYYYKRFLKVGRPNATASEHLCMVELEVYGWYCDSWSVLKSRSVSWQNSNPNTWFDCIYVVVGRDQWIQLFFNHLLLKAAIVTKFGMQHYIFERMINVITPCKKLKTDAKKLLSIPPKNIIIHWQIAIVNTECMHRS